MANQQIPNLPAAIALTGAEQLEAVQAGTSVRVTVGQLGGYFTNIVVGQTPILGGTDGRVIYDDAGVIGEYTVTGTAGSVVLSNSPVLTTPNIGAASGTSFNQVTITPPATAATLTLADNSTLTTVGAYGETLTFTGTTNVTFPTTGTLATVAGTTLDVATIAALRLLTSASATVIVNEYHSGTGKGGGAFWWDSASTAADNGGTVIKCTSITTGRYKRLYSPSYDVTEFGAKGDGVTDDSTAINVLLAIGGTVTFAPGTYYITVVLSTTVAGTKIKGLGKVTIATGAAMITSAIRAWADDCSVENIEIDASSSPNLNSGIHMAGHRYLIRDVTITGGTYNPRLPKTIPGPYYGIYVGGPGNYVMYTDGVLDNILTTGGNTGIVVQGGKRLNFSKIINFQPAGFGTAVGGGLSVQDFTLTQFSAISCGQYGFSNSSQFGASGIEPRPMSNWTLNSISAKWCGWQSLFTGINGGVGAGKFGFDITDGSFDGLTMQASAIDCCAGGMETKAGYSSSYDVTLTTSSGTASGTTLNFASTSTVYVGMAVSGANIPADTYIASKTSTTVVLTRAVTGAIASGASILFEVAISPEGHKNILIDFHYNSTTATPVHGSQGVLAVLEDSVSDQFFGEKQNIRVFCSTKQAPTWRSDLYKYAWEPVASNGLLWLCLGALADGQPGKTGQTAPSSAGAYVGIVTNGAALAGTSVLSFASVTGMVAGQAVFGVGVQDGTTISSVDAIANDITLSLPLISPGVANGAYIICATLESDGALYWLCLGTDYSGSVNNNNTALQINCVSYIYADVVSINNGYGVYLSSTRSAASNAIDNVNINLRAIGARYGFAMDGVGVVTNCTLSSCDVAAEIAVYVGGAGGTNNLTISGGKFSGVQTALYLANATNNVTLVGDPYFLSGSDAFQAGAGTNTLKISSALFEGGADGSPPVYFAGTSVNTVWWGSTVIDNKNAANQYGGWYAAGTATVTSHGGPYRRDLLTNPNTVPQKGNVGEHMVLDTPTSTVWGYVCTVGSPTYTWQPKSLNANVPIISTKTANYTITAADDTIVCTTNAFTVTLPTAIGLSGREFTVKNANTLASGNLITMATTAAQTIDGIAPGTIAGLSSQTFVSDNANWWIV